MLARAKGGPPSSAVVTLLSNWGFAPSDAHHLERRHPGSGYDEFSETLRAIDTLSLLPGRARHLLRVSRSLAALRDECSTPRTWCTYKQGLCNCGRASAGAPDVSPPALPPVPSQLLSLDCEFRPWRVAAVDERRIVSLDVLIPDRHSFPMIPGVLACDRKALQFAEIAEVRLRLLEHMARGGTIIGHTIEHDLTALGLSKEQRPAGARVLDVARTDESGRTVPLRTMASDDLGLEMHGKGERHCAVQDAEVAMRLYLLQRDAGGS